LNHPYLEKINIVDLFKKDSIQFPSVNEKGVKEYEVLSNLPKDSRSFSKDRHKENISLKSGQCAYLK